ncbi:hypothetical protein BST36_08190 [Mycolicibacterium moriokaense]|uniref:ATP-dependent acyl-CoA ligase n=2 Tax=Mycolicibacterium moriokaense TaxID=39691 RepID=A0AAD1HG25_9MYCO|nr:AMP-binding protein [Mycolicibacterium moriokaense]ORB25049.1 hypothetical protein BST36_08190 [Mycolicibacterium moriokaense]BBX04723.1 ATP-dependent acyl-CoA ligase [Mycolicibacterium moriokaense]
MHQIHRSDIRHRIIGSLLPEQADANGDSLWLMIEDREYTFGQANALVGRYAAGFAEIGTGHSDRVAVMMDNSEQYIFTALALAHLGSILVPINTAYRGEFLTRILQDCAPSCLVIDEKYGEQLSRVVASIPSVKRIVVNGNPEVIDADFTLYSLDELASSSDRVSSSIVSYSDTLSITFSSGTTGRSKGVIQSNAYWYNAAIAMAIGRDIRETDVFHMCTPLFHSGAWLLNVFPSLIFGLPVGIQPRFSVGDYWSSVRAYGATQLFTLSAMHIWLWNQPATDTDADNPARIWTAVPLPGDLAAPFKKRFALEAVLAAYGSTEAMPITIGNVNKSTKPNSSGWAQPYLQVEIVDEHDVIQPRDTVGEIVVRPKVPEAIFNGYYNLPQATMNATRNQWLHTGDLGRIDEDGELFFVDRKADYLRRRGENISSMEVEAAVLAHPDVEQAAVHSVPAEDSEDEVKLCVVRRLGSTLTHLELAEFCVDNLPYFVVPRYIEFLTELPRTPTERVQKYLLKERGVTEATWDAKAVGWEARR